MALGLIGRKIGMTRIFRDTGKVVPVTIIEAGPCPVIRVRTPSRDGYTAVQLGFMDIERRKLSKPVSGQFPENVPPKRHLKEFRLLDGEEGRSPGDVLHVDFFQAGQKVDIRGRTKGRGVAGTIKRWGFHGGPGGHGHMSKRLPGSIGSSSDPHKVFKGKRMSGRYGNETVCIQGLEVVAVNPENNTIAVKGAVPGPTDGILYIIPTRRERRPRRNRQ